MKKQLREFLQKCMDPRNWEANPILQDYMPPEMMEEIEKWLEFERKFHNEKRVS